MSWNPVLDLVLNIKYDYKSTFNDNNLDFKNWLKKLNKKEYNDIFNCLQINQHNNLILIRYGLAEMQKGMWENQDSIYRECRSVVIDLENECLVLTPFRKFFNLNEVEENKIEIVLEKLKNAETIEIVDKLDGSMQSARYYNGEIIMSGSMALNIENSWRLEDGYSMLTENHKKLIKKYPEFTFIFEYISLKDAHVVKYNKKDEGLYLIGVRHIETGKQLSYKNIIDLGKLYNIKTVKIENATLEDILEKSKVMKSDEKEGWILNIDGHLIKIKCDDYIKLHRLLDKYSSINLIIETVAENRVDDLLSKIPYTHKENIKKIIDKITTYEYYATEEIYSYYNLAPKDDIKTFMKWVTNNVPYEAQGYVRNIYKNKPFNVLKTSRNNRYKKINELNLNIFAEEN